MSDLVEGAACRPNFSAAGRKRRTQIAWAGIIFSFALLVALLVIDASWQLRLLVGLPAAMAAITGLQVRRNTCVAHAMAGTFENEDFSTTKVDAAFAAASKKVAATIYRDGLLTGAGVALLAAATTVVR